MHKQINSASAWKNFSFLLSGGKKNFDRSLIDCFLFFVNFNRVFEITWFFIWLKVAKRICLGLLRFKVRVERSKKWRKSDWWLIRLISVYVLIKRHPVLDADNIHLTSYFRLAYLVIWHHCVRRPCNAATGGGSRLQSLIWGHS